LSSRRIVLHTNFHSKFQFILVYEHHSAKGLFRAFNTKSTEEETYMLIVTPIELTLVPECKLKA